MFLLEFIEPGEEAEEQNKFIILVTLWTANLCAKIEKISCTFLLYMLVLN